MSENQTNSNTMECCICYDKVFSFFKNDLGERTNGNSMRTFVLVLLYKFMFLFSYDCIEQVILIILTEIVVRRWS